jgi:hypothetical protein
MTAREPDEAAALADPALDPWFSRGHGHPDWRRAVVLAIAGCLAGGDAPEVLPAEYGLPLEAVEAVRDWAKRWPGAW